MLNYYLNLDKITPKPAFWPKLLIHYLKTLTLLAVCYKIKALPENIDKLLIFAIIMSVIPIIKFGLI
jgi:hypothetical protein